MDSEREREIFEAEGWYYEYIDRAWIAPDGFTVTTDDLMVAANMLTAARHEARVRDVAAEHGRDRLRARPTT